MPRTFSLLDQVVIPSPCPMPWNEMQGDNRVRHCSHCNHAVHDLSALTRERAESVLRNEGNLCIQIRRNRDGDIITADRPFGRRTWPRLLRPLGAAAAWVVCVLVQSCGVTRTGGAMPMRGRMPCNPCAEHASTDSCSGGGGDPSEIPEHQ